MTVNSTWAVQKAIYVALSGETAVTSLLASGANSVFDHVVAGSSFPYIVIGQMQQNAPVAAADMVCDLACTIEILSRNPGLKEVKTIAAEVRSLLHNADLAVEGHQLILCRETGTDFSIENDGETRLGALQYHIVVEATF